MRSSIILGVAAAAMLLGGCNYDIAGVLAASQASQATAAADPAKPATSTTPAATAAADAPKDATNTAICKWAADAGIPALNVDKADTTATKKKLAGVFAAHKATCATKKGA